MIKINSNLMVQGQGYMVDVTSLPNQAQQFLTSFWLFFFACCLQFVPLTTLNIRINRLVPWKQLKKYHTFPIPPIRHHSLVLMQLSFLFCLWWFITLGPWSFPNDVILNNQFFINSANSFKKSIEFIAFKMQITSVDAFCWMNFFNSYAIQISSVLKSPRRCIWRSIVDFGIFNISSISRTVTWRCDSIMALVWLSSTSFGRPERCSSLKKQSEKSPERNLSNQFRHYLSFKASSPYTLHNFLAACAAFFPLRKLKSKIWRKCLFLQSILKMMSN